MVTHTFKSKEAKAKMIEVTGSMSNGRYDQSNDK